MTSLIPLLRNRKFQHFVLQSAFLGIIFGLLIAAVVIGQRNMAEQGLVGGFGFLERNTGWRINFTLIDYDIRSSYTRALAVGALNTVFLGAITLLLATAIGLLVGVARLSSNKLATKLGVFFVEIFRNVPIVLQALFWYAVLTHLPKGKDAFSPFAGVYLSGRGAYLPGLNVTSEAAALAILMLIIAFCFVMWVVFSRRTSRLPTTIRRSYWVGAIVAGLIIASLILIWGRVADTPLFSMPYLKGLNFKQGIRLSPEFTAAVIAISLFGAAYIAEIFRAGLLSVHAGMSEAGTALGLKHHQVFWRIRLPLAFRSILPILTNQYVWLIKATTIGIAIGFSDFFMVIAISINQSGQTIILIMLLIIGFWILNFSLAGIFNWINRKIAIKGTH